MNEQFSIKMHRMKLLLISLALFASNTAFADFGVLVAQGVLVEKNPETPALVEDEEAPELIEVGTATDASYVSSGGWAATGTEFIDAAVFVFDMGVNTTVSQASLTLPIDAHYPQNDSIPLEVYVYSDNGVVEYTDYSIGFTSPIAEVDAALLGQVQVDVTGPVNAALGTGQYVAFRIKSGIGPSEVSETLFPSWTGVKFNDEPYLEFTPGAAPVLANDVARFDGYTLEVPNIEVAGVGEAAVQLRLVDVNELRFQLTFAEITGAGVGAPPFSGIDLYNCEAFSPPASAIVAAGASTYSVNSEILDIPSTNFNNEQVALRLEHIEGTDPWMFETLSMSAVQSGPSEASISALGGGALVEPSQDFVPLCHGWVLIGDSLRNRVVERNLISGETGATYPFNTIPDQFTADEENGMVYMTVHPESERLYKLDLSDGSIVSNRVQQTLSGLTDHTYSWSLRDIALGEDGNVFAMMVDNILFDPLNNIAFSGTGLWMGLMDPDANFLMDSIPLESPVRIEYDSVLDHVFLATESNLATFNFDPGTNQLTFVPGTDVTVGNSCTDFSVSPDGTRLAYSCPEGNRDGQTFSIVDMDPEAYFDADGEWYLGSSPKSATFDSTGTLLIATDNEKLYVYDVVTHLILEDFELGLLAEESIKKIRLSRDGEFLILFLENDLHAENSKFYWMPMPDVQGTPLP